MDAAIRKSSTQKVSTQNSSDQKTSHQKFYDVNISDWWCSTCNTVTDFCTEDFDVEED